MPERMAEVIAIRLLTCPYQSIMDGQEGIMLTQEKLKSILHYDPKTGVFTWRVRQAFNTHIGERAGNLCKVSGYWRIGLEGRHYKASRLAVLYMTGEWPKGIVDHKDRVRSNDVWENLRDVSYAVNNANMSKKSRQVGTNVPGVYWYANRKKWRVSVTWKGKQLSCGYYDDVELAELVATEARAKLYG